MIHGYASLGSISSATHKLDDLIPTFVDELEYLTSKTKCDSKPTLDFCRDVRIRMANPDYYESNDSNEDLSELFDRLNDFAPPYAYFGAHEGDGADFGFWLEDERSMREGILEQGGMIVDDLGKVPLLFTGEVLEINDHGNATLWNVRPIHDGATTKSKFTEVWSVV